MNWRLVGRLLMLSSNTALLSGCVALVVPIAAGGVIGRKGLQRHQVRQENVALAKTLSAIPLPAVEPDSIASGQASAPIATPSFMQPVRSPTRPVTPGDRVRSAKPRRIELALAAPPPRAASAAPLAMYQAFVQYTLNEHDAGKVGGLRRSAVLAPATDLRDPKALPCGMRPTAVIVDVDVLGSPDAAKPIGAATQMLRADHVTVLWIGNVREAGGGVRARLAKAGLAAMPADHILEAHDNDTRKQVLRQKAASQFCVVAVAGARRGDMDELYDYLRPGADALKLDRRFGAGWFLTTDPR